MFRFERRPQTYANHAKFEPLYHFVAFGILVANLVWTARNVFASGGLEAWIALALALALLILFFAMRVFTLTVQDRVIRLEERLRLERLLPADLKPRIEELTPRQLVALRFASDAELAALVRDVLVQKIEDPRAIKRKIQTWRPDYLRC
ncbi:MAG: hypothetical protein HZA53_11725 [Planctomycetes bacterium]|nr:hypothetical protein [Planctomycetota bacterium]